MTLKRKAIDGLVWSFIENFLKQLVLFSIGIVLARLLSPEEFGLIGISTIFITLSKTFIDGGFSQALIRKQDCTDEDYSTVFYINLCMGSFLALILYLSAGLISQFFKQPPVLEIIEVLSVLLLINALTIIQRTQMIKKINFKMQAKISVTSELTGGVLAIGMALSGWGVWSLVLKQITTHSIETFLLWLQGNWRPKLTFSKSSFTELFGFGSKLLAANILNTLFKNIYLIVIGRYFSAAHLGYFTRAQQFNDLPSQNINNIIQRVTYPVLSSLQDNPKKLKDVYRKILSATMLITFPLMIGLASIAEPLIMVLLGEKWSQSIIYLQLLTFIGACYPLNSLNLNILKVAGRSDIFLILEVIKKILIIPAVIVGINYGIESMILAMWGVTIIALIINSYWTGKFLNYNLINQLRDILPALSISSIMGTLVFILGKQLGEATIIGLLLQIVAGLIIMITLTELFKLKSYIELKKIIAEKIIRKK